MISNELYNSYSKSSYFVRLTDRWVRLRIGQPCPQILLDSLHGESWSIITAYNPYSNILSPYENKLRDEQLRIDTKEVKRFRAYGAGPSWTEFGYLILGPFDLAVQLAKKYDQHALVCGFDTPTLVLCSSF